MLLFRFLGNGFRLALCNVSLLATRESVVLVPDPIGFAPWPVLSRHGTRCGVLSQVHRKGDLGDEVDGMKRKRRRRLQPLVYMVFQLTICLWLLCFSFRKLLTTQGVSSRVVLCFFHSTVCVDPFATRNSPFACWCRHSTCVTMFSQVRLVYLIFAVPQTWEQIVGCQLSPPRSMRR